MNPIITRNGVLIYLLSTSSDLQEVRSRGENGTLSIHYLLLVIWILDELGSLWHIHNVLDRISVNRSLLDIELRRADQVAVNKPFVCGRVHN